MSDNVKDGMPLKRVIFGPQPVTERIKYPPPPPPPPKDFYPRKPKFWQLRGTEAAVYRRNHNLIFTAAAMFVGYLIVRYGDGKRKRMMKFYLSKLLAYQNVLFITFVVFQTDQDDETYDDFERKYIESRTKHIARQNIQVGHNPVETPADIREDIRLRAGVAGSGYIKDRGTGYGNWQERIESIDE